MARFKPVQKGLMLLPVNFSEQIVPGTFEHALCYLVDQELDLTSLRDDTGTRSKALRPMIPRFS